VTYRSLKFQADLTNHRPAEGRQQEKEKLQRTKVRLEQELARRLGSLDEELKILAAHWNEYPLEKRIALINFLIQEMSLDMMSPRWMRIRIQWTREDWGCEQMYLLREEEKAPRWTPEELEYLEAHLLTASKDELMEHLDTRTWQAIRNRGYVMGITRHKYGKRSKTMPSEANFCVRDYRFMWEMGLTETSTRTEWESLSIPR
jgi:hypothetical protein